jgi:hypothetical protein
MKTLTATTFVEYAQAFEDNRDLNIKKLVEAAAGTINLATYLNDHQVKVVCQITTGAKTEKIF